MTKHILLIDNFDSFVHNLTDEFKLLGHKVSVFRANLALDAALDFIATAKPELLVFSPGPGNPSQATLVMDLLQNCPENIPILGVCLGHQCITQHFGGNVGTYDAVIHGKSTLMTHNGDGLFKQLESPLFVGRYHSLVSTTLPNCLEATAFSNDLIMAIQHRTRPIYGIQFHPESILTPDGSVIIQNLLETCHG